MSGWFLWIGGPILAIIVAAALIEAYLKRNTKRRLSEMRPDPKSLKRRSWEPDLMPKVNNIDAVNEKNQKIKEQTKRSARGTTDVKDRSLM